MAHQVALITRLSLGLLINAAFQTHCGHSLPSWFQVPFLRDRSGGVGSADLDEDVSDFDITSDGPESLLYHQLKSIDEMSNPEKARALHAGIAKILRAEGRQIPRAIQHLEAARNFAMRGDDADAILDAHLELAELYTEAGRPEDASRELDGKLRSLTPENFWEYSVKLDRANGHASFESGFIKLAMEYFEDAEQVAVEPEDIVRSATDLAMAHACLGRSQNSLQPLRKALEVLEKARKADTLEVALHRPLAREVHSRLAEAFHFLGDLVSAKVHYQRASQLQSKSPGPASPRDSAIKSNSRNAESGASPAIRCPGGSKSQKFQLNTQKDAGAAFKAKVASLLAAKQHRKAEFELWNYLELQARPYKKQEAATTLNSLGQLYLSSERRSYYKAGNCFMQALRASLSCCGAQSREAKAAFRGLKFVQDLLPTKDQTKALAIMQEYREAADKFGVSANDLGQRYKANELQSQPPALQMIIDV